MLAPTFVSLLLASGLVSGLPQPADNLVEHERAASVPSSWQLVRSATPDDVLTLRIAVKEHRKVDEKHILGRSDPKSPLYGKYMSAEQLRALLRDSTSATARKASWDKVQRWIDERNIHVVRDSDRGFEIKIRAAEAESLFGTKFSYYTRDGDDQPVARTEAYSLPLGIRDDVDFVYPTVHFFDGAKARAAEESKLDRRQHGLPTGPWDCSKYICPVNLTSMYNIDYMPETASASKLALGGFLEQNANLEDFKNFTSQYGLSDASLQAPYTIVNVNGAENSQDEAKAELEAQLDIEYSTSFLGPLNVTYHLTGGRPPAQDQPGNVPIPDEDNQQEPYLEYLDYLLAQNDIPQVVSISYTDDEQAVPQAYANQVCDRFSYLALRGVSVLVASGDAGTQGTRFSDCKGPEGQYRFIPTFPASCPWVTTVGATTRWGGVAGFSAGGFSNYFPQPDWQKDAVAKYIASSDNTGVPEDPWFAWNASGRAYPDLSLLGVDYLVINRGIATTAKGTSASTPVVASMIALLNDIRLRAGKPVLGFLNPLLYAADVAEGAFTDITESNINGCSNAAHQQAGFAAAKGWDAASGLGTPDFAKLRKLLT
ncbi:tripeptidyl-peptidase sed4 [Apiospora marii]|uniref:tripeptidyl-peptidase sed4 n=1 Tax=Apiospora marii TaxID=335849 RepID=UPI00312FD7B6